MSAFLNHAGASPPTDAVVRRMVTHLQREQEIGGYEAADEAAAEIASTRGSLARLVGGLPAEIALAGGATDAFERVMFAHLADRGFFAHPARIVVDPFTYSSMWLALSRWAQIRPLHVDVAAPADDGTVDQDSLNSLVDERTDAVLLTHMPTHQGTVTDAGRLFPSLRDAAPAALFVLDISQTVGQLPIDVGTIGCDVAFAPGRKFLRGPRGTGFAWVRHDIATSLDPLSLAFGSTVAGASVHRQPDDATRFETFERPIAALLGLGVAAAEALVIGVDTIASRIADRSDAIRSILDGRNGIRRLGTDSDRGIVTFTHDALGAAEASQRLVAAGIANRYMAGEPPMCDAGGGFEDSVRLSPHHITTDDELARLADALGRVS
ncbi:MAG TPA: aminotransferase class V-fold PLP-dependent enzyme [Microthrixaceae bacterium]|nr:aminotransferase class V-fold PLP-dependent enzyme [Microthrixaceae bacterium]HNI34734.1 aminotransferase class V-fold PLP-dependent enzyme [Microthrixaceae bacterium]